jgi:DNA modification methylase
VVRVFLTRKRWDPGDTFFAPFGGAGGGGVAAARLGRHFLGNDTCAEALRIAESRLREAGAQETVASVTPTGTTEATHAQLDLIV